MKRFNLIPFLQEITHHVSDKKQKDIVQPTDGELQEWGNILNWFRAGKFDSCKISLSRYNYNLIELQDAITGNTYDVFKERYPIRKGWGTFVYNRNHKKRIYIHVNHPVDDPNAGVIGAELFRKLDAEWLLIAGTRKFSGNSKSSFDIGKEKRTVFQRWHELLTDLTHITLSVHGFSAHSYSQPLGATEVVLSNGKTTDDQWGISQISLAFRDSIRSAGFTCGLAMYDSGYARLAGGWNIQGMFTNDSVGFGHWFYLELSNNVRENPALYLNFVTAANRALELTGKKVSQQMNRAWGLVSPRIVKVDSLHGILFPPATAETYRIISFNANNMKNDTLDIRMGNWMEVLGSSKTIARVTRLDSSQSSIVDRYRRGNRNRSGQVVSEIVKETSGDPTHRLHVVHRAEADSSDGEDEALIEPLQVHRIPLRPVLASTISSGYTDDVMPFRWEGIVSERFIPGISTFQISDNRTVADALNTIPNFLIPIINSSYRTGRSKFIGVQMTEMLINEIARLVTEHKASSQDVGLIAEQMPDGDYFLRIFPSNYKKGQQNYP